MTRFQQLLKDHPEIERELSNLARDRAESGRITEAEAREALGLPPLDTSPPKKKRRKFFAFADAALL
jgi:hypothetical protein